MEVSAGNLLEILLEFDRRLPRKMKIIAIGGTALTLLGKKASTKDVDFCFLDENDRNSFIKTAESMGYARDPPTRLFGNGIAIDHYSRGYIFCVQLPEDYPNRAKEIRKMQKIELYALSPIDLVITKAARLNDRDKEDILTIIRSYEISQEELVERWIATMEHSTVRDAKDHLIILMELFRSEGSIDKAAMQKAKAWLDEKL